MLETNVNKVRDTKFDILRGIGILLMIMGHMDFGVNFDYYIFGFHMPIFFFVSGYFFNGEKYDSIWGHVKHDLKTLILPYTVFWFICQILHYIYVQDFTWQYSILSYFTSNHNRIDVSGAYWFLLCLFTAKQIFLLLYKFLKEKWFCISIVLITLLGNIIGNYCRSFLKLPLCLDSAMSAMLLLYLGYIYKKHNANSIVKRMMNLPLWAILIGLVLNAALIFLNSLEASVNLRSNYYSIIPLYWINAITAIWLHLQLSDKIANCRFKPLKVISKPLEYLGKNSITFLVLNELMIFTVNTAFSILKISTVIPDIVLRFIVLALVMISLVIANEVINRTPLKIIIGKTIVKKENKI